MNTTRRAKDLSSEPLHYMSNRRAMVGRAFLLSDLVRLGVAER